MGYAHQVAEGSPEYGFPPEEKTCIDKLKTILKSGNETAAGIVKGTIDMAFNQIEYAKKPWLWLVK